MKKIKFVGDVAENLVYQPTPFNKSYYQICQFKNPKTNLYSVRKVFFNEQYKIIKVSEKEYDAKTVKKFMNNTNENKYKLFPTNNVSYLAHPTGSDFLNMCSDLTATKVCAKWDNMGCCDEYNQYNYCGLTNATTMASPGNEISKMRRKVGSAPKEFYDGAPTLDNLFQINNNQI